jgi:hypothetical protein
LLRSIACNCHLAFPVESERTGFSCWRNRSLQQLNPDQVTAHFNAMAGYADKTSRVERKPLRGRLLLGRGTIFPLRYQSCRPFGGICFFTGAARQIRHGQ